MKISSKILLSYIIVAFIIGGMQYSVFRAFTLTTGTVNYISEKTEPLIFAVDDLRTAGLRMLSSSSEYAMIVAEGDLTADRRSASRVAYIAGAAEEEEEELLIYSGKIYESALERIRKHMLHLHRSDVSHAVSLDQLRNLEEQSLLFRKRCLELVDLKKRGVTGVAVLNKKEEVEESEERFLRSIEGVLRRESEWFSLKKEELAGSISTTKQILIIASFLTVILLFVTGLIVNKAVSKPVRELIGHMNELGKGRFAATIDSQSRDEIGELTAAVNKMASDLSISLEKEKKAVEKATTASVIAEQKQKRVDELRRIVTERDMEIVRRKAFQEQLHLAANVIENAIDGIFLTDRQGTIVQVNPSFSAITGYSSEDAIRNNPRMLKSGRHGPDFYKKMWASLIREGKWQGEIWNRRKNGAIYPAWLSINAIENEKRETTHYVAVFHDISELKGSQEKLRYQAYHDPLTKLPNRELFNDRLRKAIEHNKRHHGRLALLYLDLDNFKNINDIHGHYTGDQVVMEVAGLLTKNCRAEDTVARLGGDEFVILMPAIESPGQVIDIANRILKLLKKPFVVNKTEMQTGASIGITYYPDDGDNAETLIKNADMAMYQAKKAGKNMFHVFTQELGAEFQARMAMETALGKAFEREEFSVFYQPKVNLNTGEVVGCEALIRWQDSAGNIISPAAFLPLAEETKLIVPIGEWVLCTSCRQAKLWYDKGYSLKVAVNLSAQQFKADDLAELVKSILQETGLPPSGLELEVTESILMEDKKITNETLDKIRNLGVSIAIDDFGTGYSSLSYLRKLPIDVLKIDRSFIKEIPEVPEDMAITRTILSMAKELGLRVVAEGVETQEHLDFLREHGCEMMQGYLFSPPVPADKFEMILQDKRRLPIG